MSKHGRINTKLRQAMVEQYAKENNLPFNLVMGAVLWTAERLNTEPGFRLMTESGRVARMSKPTLMRLLSPLILAKYQAELKRRELAAQKQLRGVVRNAIPKHLRQDEFITFIVDEVEKVRCQKHGVSISEIKAIARLRSDNRDKQESLPFPP